MKNIHSNNKVYRMIRYTKDVRGIKCAVALSIKGRRRTNLNCNCRSINSQAKCKKTTLMLFFCFLLKLMRIKNVRNRQCIDKKRTKLRIKQC